MPPDAPRIRVVEYETSTREVHTRMPFRYGVACLTHAPSLLVRATIEDSRGRRARGLAGDLLPPRWFDKDPEKSLDEEVREQREAVARAGAVYLELGARPRNAVELWREALPEVVARCAAARINALTASFGSSFFERAMLDALSRLHSISFFDALSTGMTGLPIAEFLPPRPLEHLRSRHTVGLADPITSGEILPEERLDDGLPQALEECIDRYGLYFFKVKVRGENDVDLQRLEAVAQTLERHCRRPYTVTLDGNEQYRDASGLLELLDRLAARPMGSRFLERVLFIEQPLARDVALGPDAARGIRELARRKPVTIDESDALPETFQQALALGYHGVSHKNCKGIFKSLENRERIVRLNEELGEERYFQTAEDLANLPVVPLQEDLAAVAALGIDHVERNGHHYFRGLDHLPPEEAESALRAHPDLYHRIDGRIALRIEEGEIACGSLACTGFGYAAEIAFGSG